MPLTAGATIGRYQVRQLLGSGGMGEVYKAHDPTLGRSVAIKVLREKLSADAEGVTRFMQEARAASALNHPNILTIHELGEVGGSRYMVAEFVEGETVRQRVERAPVTLGEILDIAIQTSSALAAAHAAGIVHRDIKPENLMLRPDGYIKVLDFGVAKLAERAASAADAGIDATIAADTGIGMVVGTMAYMSPEQARGLAVDGRADTFSVGVVLYELLTGRTPFGGATPSDILVAILDKEPPPLRQLARGLPLQLDWIVAKALDKNPQLRYQTIADLRVDLIRLKSGIESGRIAERVEAAPTSSADQAIEVELTQESPQVQALGRVPRSHVAAAAIAIAAVVAAAFTYDRARPGAELPLQVPEGAVLTKARDAVQALGYTNFGSRTAIDFKSSTSSTNIVALAGSAALRDAVRQGAVGYWAVGISASRAPNPDNEPLEGDYAVRLSPRGNTVSFATGVSQQAVTALDRDHAIKTGLDTIRRVLGIDASAYETEFVQRAFPAGTVEMTWRNPARVFGHIEQLRVNLQGDRIVRLAHSFETPPGFTEPQMSAPAKFLKPVSPVLTGVAVFSAWVFGMVMLVKTKSWDPVRQRLPIAICAVVLISIGLAMATTQPGWQVALGLVFIAVLIIGTGLPALSGIMLWLRRRSPARLWTMDQLAFGRVTPAVSAALLAGLAAGAAVAALHVAADFVSLQIPGFLPSISRELEAVDKGFARIVSDGLTSACFTAFGIALAVEALDRARLRPVVATGIIALAGALVANELNHQTVLAALPMLFFSAAIAVINATVYRVRGLLACFASVAVSEIALEAMAARSLDDPSLVTQSNLAIAVVAAIGALAIWGLVTARIKQPRPAAA